MALCDDSKNMDCCRIANINLDEEVFTVKLSVILQHSDSTARPLWMTSLNLTSMTSTHGTNVHIDIMKYSYKFMHI